MDQDKFEVVLTRGIAIGGLGGLVPFYIAFAILGVPRPEKWHMYIAVIIFLTCLGLVNKARELVRSSNEPLPRGNAILTSMKLAAVGAAFLIGSILSLGFVLIFVLF